MYCFCHDCVLVIMTPSWSMSVRSELNPLVV